MCRQPAGWLLPPLGPPPPPAPHLTPPSPPLQVCDLQVALLAAQADGEAAHHLGIQDPVPGRPVPAGPEKGACIVWQRPERSCEVLSLGVQLLPLGLDDTSTSGAAFQAACPPSSHTCTHSGRFASSFPTSFHFPGLRRSSSATATRWCAPTCGSCGTWTCRWAMWTSLLSSHLVFSPSRTGRCLWLDGLHSSWCCPDRSSPLKAPR